MCSFICRCERSSEQLHGFMIDTQVSLVCTAYMYLKPVLASTQITPWLTASSLLYMQPNPGVQIRLDHWQHKTIHRRLTDQWPPNPQVAGRVVCCCAKLYPRRLHDRNMDTHELLISTPPDWVSIRALPSEVSTIRTVYDWIHVQNVFCCIEQ